MTRRYWYKKRRNRSSGGPPYAIVLILVLFIIGILKYLFEHIEQFLLVSAVGALLYFIYLFIKRHRRSFDSIVLQTNNSDLILAPHESADNDLIDLVGSNTTESMTVAPLRSVVEKFKSAHATQGIPVEPRTAVIHNESGALSDLLQKIHDSKITSFKDVIDFKNNFETYKEKVSGECIAEVKAEIPKIKEELGKLNVEKNNLYQIKSTELSSQMEALEAKLVKPEKKSGFMVHLITKFRNKYWTSRLNYLKKNLNSILEEATLGINERILKVEKKISYIDKNIEDIAKEKAQQKIVRLDRINDILNQNKYLVYGVSGELKVISNLKTLPPMYHVINDYKREFYKPIYNKKKDDRIYSIQIDHIVVGPTGVFIIETKYWSKKSVESTELFSPVKQIERSAFAMFVILNDAIKNGRLFSLVTNWGARKISPRQIIASIGPVPHSEFQFVKVLGIDQLVPYITSGKNEYSQQDVEGIVKYLIKYERKS